MLPDSFQTLASPSQADFRDRASRFLAFAFPVETELEMREEVKKLKREHHAATHVCWAWVGAYDGSEEKSTDDREPSGSAGKPILRAIQEKGLTQTGVAVVRYFGGKLLGVPGLIHAYGESARLSLEAAQVETRKVLLQYFQECEFEVQHEIIRICKKHQIKFYPDHHQGLSGITFELPPSIKDPFLLALSERGFSETKEIRIFHHA